MVSRTGFAVEERILLERACEAIRAVEPGARVVLHGSRARGTADPEADWDLLVLVDGEVDQQRKTTVHAQLLDLGLETGAVLNAMVFGRHEWDSARMRVYPLRANVEEDGIELTSTSGGIPAAEQERPTEREMAEAREDLVREWLERARQTLGAAEDLAHVDRWNDCVNRLYYACFDAGRALLLQRGYRFSKHSSVQSLLNGHFGKTGAIPADLMDLYNRLFKARGAADYEAFVRFSEPEVRPLLTDARRFVEVIEALIRSPHQGEPPG